LLKDLSFENIELEVVYGAYKSLKSISTSSILLFGRNFFAYFYLVPPEKPLKPLYLGL